MQFYHFSGMGSYQLWPCHVTQAEDLSFSYLKSNCLLDFRKSNQISWFFCIPNGSYKEDSLKEGRIPCAPMPSKSSTSHRSGKQNLFCLSKF